MNTRTLPTVAPSAVSTQDTEVSCYHCGLAVPKHCHYPLLVDGVQQPMCCIGCLAAAEFIQQQGMGNFYQYRGGQLPQTAVSGQFADHSSWQYYDQPEIQALYQDGTHKGADKAENKRGNTGNHADDEATACTRIYVQGMYCNSCSWLIDSALSQLPGVRQIQLNPATRQLQLNWQPGQSKLSEILGTIARLGYQPRPLQANESSVDRRETENRKSLRRLAVAGFGMMQVMTYAIAVYWGDYQGIEAGIREFLQLISMLVATVVVFYAGQPFFRHAWHDLKNRHPGMDVPVALAIGGAYAASVWQLLIDQQDSAGVYFDSAVMFVFFLSLGRFVEMRARYHAASGADALRQLLPALVRVWRDGETLTLTPEQVVKGDQIDVSAGDIIPCDARIISGEGWLDESLLTGEAQAVARSGDDPVTSGTVLKSGCLRLSATRDWEQSTLASIRHLLDRAQSYRPQRIRLADQLARHFVAALLILIILVATFWYFHAPGELFRIVLAMLIASCPCAFSLATPAVLTVASHFLSRHGVLLSNPDACETLLAVDHWCFDKTGTLSTAELTIRQVDRLADRSEQECLSIIGSIEQHSDHVLASTFPPINSHQVAAVEVAHGQGISACVDGTVYFVGSLAWVAEQCAVTRFPGMAQQQHSIVVLGQPGKLLAVVYLSDQLRTDSAATLQALSEQGKTISLLSGDRSSVVKRFAKHLPVNHCRGDLLPIDKMQYLRELQEQGQCVAMVGDGVNDAPILGQADVSIAMASGSQLSQSHADIILLGGRLTGVLTASKVSARARRIIRQNLAWAILYNLTVLPLAAFGLLEPWMAALGMSLSSLLVVLNARRLNRLKL